MACSYFPLHLQTLQARLIQEAWTDSAQLHTKGHVLKAFKSIVIAPAASMKKQLLLAADSCYLDVGSRKKAVSPAAAARDAAAL